MSPGAPVQTQLLRELPAGPVATPGPRRGASGSGRVHRLPAVPTHHIHLRRGEDPSRAEGGRVRPGAAAGRGGPRPGGPGGGRAGR